ncbi:acyl carrier protein [Amycolatopsis japonica]|uniref:acyl carrier protein n=1 Tax=Amycolatopsis japonica TaxID=208439 RepID=UPI00366CBD74
MTIETPTGDSFVDQVSFTIDDLRNLLRDAVGVEDGVDLDGRIEDVPFGDLGYDSLALIEMASHLKRTSGIVIPDDAAAELSSPRAAVEIINAHLADRDRSE